MAFLGGIDLDHGSRDDADHRGDRQSVGADPVYGPNPAYHDLQLAAAGSGGAGGGGDLPRAVAEPGGGVAAALARRSRTGSTAFAAPPRRFRRRRPHPPPTGTCAVQLLRTYPRRRPRYPYAPRGERSIALAYTKALGRAEQLIYVEDQYLWSFDVARIFAAALQRSPRLQLIAVVPRRPDNENQFYNEAAMLGHAEALAMVREAGGDRVQVLDVENLRGPARLRPRQAVRRRRRLGGGRQRQLQHEVVDARLRADRRGGGLRTRPARADRSRRARGRSPPVRSRAAPDGCCANTSASTTDDDLLDPVAGRGHGPQERRRARRVARRRTPRTRGPPGGCAATPSARKAGCPPGIAGSPPRSTGPSSTRTAARSTCDCGAPTDPPPLTTDRRACHSRGAQIDLGSDFRTTQPSPSPPPTQLVTAVAAPCAHPRPAT